MSVYAGNIVYELSQDSGFLIFDLDDKQVAEVEAANDGDGWIDCSKLSFDIFDLDEVDLPCQVDKAVTWYFP